MKGRKLQKRDCPRCHESYQPTGSRQVLCRSCRKKSRGEDRRKYSAAKKRKCVQGNPEIPCIICHVPFRPKRKGRRICPPCLVKRSNPEEPEKLVVVPGPCNTCREQKSDNRGIAVCPVFGGMKCSEANPIQQCPLRIPEDQPRETVIDVTDTLVRRGRKLMARSQLLLDEMGRGRVAG